MSSGSNRASAKPRVSPAFRRNSRTWDGSRNERSSWSNPSRRDRSSSSTRSTRTEGSRSVSLRRSIESTACCCVSASAASTRSFSSGVRPARFSNCESLRSQAVRIWCLSSVSPGRFSGLERFTIRSLGSSCSSVLVSAVGAIANCGLSGRCLDVSDARAGRATVAFESEPASSSACSFDLSGQFQTIAATTSRVAVPAASLDRMTLLLPQQAANTPRFRHNTLRRHP